MKSLVTLTAIALAATCVSASAATLEYKPYVGFDLGYMKLHSQRGNINIPRPPLSIKLHSLFKDHQYTGTFVAGARLGEHFGVEAFVQRGKEEKQTIDLAKYGLDTSDIPVGIKPQTTTQLNFAWGLDVNGYLPVAEKLELTAGLGVGFYNFTHGVTGSLVGTPLNLRIQQEEDNVLGVRMSLGAEYKLNENWSAKTNFRYVRLDPGALEWTDNIKEFTVGLRYAF
ncbi:MAG: porin family protein [Alphaproteobacteria bacterium]|nr:porin family protein [Alphaproteobacteria bacterium]